MKYNEEIIQRILGIVRKEISVVFLLQNFKDIIPKMKLTAKEEAIVLLDYQKRQEAFYYFLYNSMLMDMFSMTKDILPKIEEIMIFVKLILRDIFGVERPKFLDEYLDSLTYHDCQEMQRLYTSFVESLYTRIRCELILEYNSFQ